MREGYNKMSQMNNEDTLVNQYDIKKLKILNPEEELNLSQFNGDLMKIFEDAKILTNKALNNFYENITELTPQNQGNELKINAGLVKNYLEHILQLHISKLQADEKLYNKIIKHINHAIKKSSYIDPQSLSELSVKNTTKEKSLEILRSIVPQTHIKPNNKLANTLTKNLIDGEGTDLKVNDKKAKNQVITKVMLNYENKNVQLISPVKFTAYDREVYDGVTTLYEAGNSIVSPVMVYRAMNGLTETEPVSDKAIDEVRKSIDKSRFIRTVIDYTDEAKFYNHEIKKTLYEGYLLAANKVMVEAGGKEIEAYKLLDKPILYEYAQISGQILSVPINLLNTRDTVNSTEDVIITRGYILRQIEWMKHEKSNRSTNITYQGVYEELEIFKDNLDEKAYKEKTFKIRSHVKSILESWRAQNYIGNFEEYKDGRQIKGVKLYF